MIAENTGLTPFFASDELMRQRSIWNQVDAETLAGAAFVSVPVCYNRRFRN